MSKTLSVKRGADSQQRLCSALSRQRLWQIAQRKNGNCESCGRPAAGRQLCDECAIRKQHVAYRKPLKSEWASAKWDRPNAVIAAYFGVTAVAVAYQRRKHTPNGRGERPGPNDA